MRVSYGKPQLLTRKAFASGPQAQFRPSHVYGISPIEDGGFQLLPASGGDKKLRQTLSFFHSAPSEREAVADESAFSSDCAVFHWLRITPPNTSAEAAHCPAVNRSSRKTIPMNNVNTGTRLRKAPVREAGTERTAKLYSKKESMVTPTPR